MLRFLAVILALCIGVIVSKIPDPGYGIYKPLDAKVKIGDLTQGGSQDAILYYPESSASTPTFPFVVFGHGWECGGNKLKGDYSQLLGTIASHGYIVAAPMSCPDKWCADFYKDLIITVQTCSAKTTHIHKSLNTAKFDKVGLVGHSMGAMSVVLAGIHGKEINASAVVSLHPCFTNANPTPAAQNIVPTMYWTGTKDNDCPSWEAYQAYNLTKPHPKTYSDLVGAKHLECFTGHPNRADPYIVQFLQCLTENNQTSCDIVTDKNKEYALCDNGVYNYAGCYVEG